MHDLNLFFDFITSSGHLVGQPQNVVELLRANLKPSVCHTDAEG